MLAVGLAAGLLAGPALAAPARASAEPMQDYLVVLQEPAAATDEATVPVVEARLTRAAAAALDARDGVVVEPDRPVSLLTERTVGSGSWGLDRLDQRGATLDGRYAYPADQAGQGVTAYVIDTGISPAHVEFGDRVQAGYSSVTGDAHGTDDCNGHGTHVAGLLGGTAVGVAPEAALVPVRVLDCSGSGWTSWVVEGINWVVADHEAGEPAVANLSLGGGASTAIDTAVAALVADGITVVVAAGNDDADACGTSPARAADAITVGASSPTDARASFSNHGTCVDVFAPGQSLRSAYPTTPTSYVSMSGTSMASPLVAGVAARYLSADPSATPAQVTGTLLGAATPGAVTDAGTGSPDLLAFADPAGFDLSAPEPPAPTAPVAPAAVTGASASAGRLTASWTAGADPDADPADTYSVTAVPAVASSVAPATRTVPADGPLRVTFGGLTPGARYAVRVVAVNGAGSSAATTSARTRVLARSTPVRSLATRSTTGAPRKSALHLTWTAPADLGGSALVRYEVRVGGGPWVGTGTATGRTVKGLRRGARVTVEVRAVTAAGPGATARRTVTTAR